MVGSRSEMIKKVDDEPKFFSWLDVSPSLKPKIKLSNLLWNIHKSETSQEARITQPQQCGWYPCVCGSCALILGLHVSHWDSVCVCVCMCVCAECVAVSKYVCKCICVGELMISCSRDAGVNWFLLPCSVCQCAGRWVNGALFVLTPRPGPVCAPTVASLPSNPLLSTYRWIQINTRF